MVARNWVGGGNNNANNPNDWSPTGLPVPGDTLSMSSGTLNISGNDLAGNALLLSSAQNHVLNLTNASASVSGPQATATINLSGINTFDYSSGELSPKGPLVFNLAPSAEWVGRLGLGFAPQATVNLAAGAKFTGGFGISRSPLNFEGQQGSSFVNNAVSQIDRTNVVVNVDVSGTGSFDLNVGLLKFGGAVGAGQTLIADFMANIDVANPTRFLGTLKLAGGIVQLENLAKADSYRYDTSSETLAAFSQGAVIFSAHVTTSGTSPLRFERDATSAYLFTSTDASPHAGRTLLADITTSPPTPPPGVLPFGPPNNFQVSDQTTGGSWQSQGETYSGPVKGLTSDIIIVTSDNINVTAEKPNVFIKTGSGVDAIDVSKVNGNNIMDGDTGSNFLTGGTGNDTFYLDDRNAAQPLWSTLVNFHKGDDATIWGITANDFTLSWADGLGAATAKGLTGTFTGGNTSTAVVTLAGLTTADLTSGKLSISFGRTGDLPNLPGSNYMLIHGN